MSRPSSLASFRPAAVLAAACTAVSTAAFASSVFAQSVPPGGYELRTVNLQGPEYVNRAGGGFSVNASGQALSADGLAAGAATRYGPEGQFIGQDAWLFDGTTTTRVGLVGEAYEGVSPQGLLVRSAIANFLSDDGRAWGTSTRQTATGSSIGQDAWHATASGATLVSLTGAEWETDADGRTRRAAQLNTVTPGGLAAGSNTRYATNGSIVGADAYLYDGTTRLAGLTGPGFEYTHSSGATFRSAGSRQAFGSPGSYVVSGWTNRYTPSGVQVGRDGWVQSPGGLRYTGLAGAGYEFTHDSGIVGRESFPQAMNASGQVLGQQARFTPAGLRRGQKAFFDDGTSAVPVGLEGAAYEYFLAGDRVVDGRASVLSAGGHAAGLQLRFAGSGVTPNASRGQDAWAFHAGETRQIGLTGPGYELVQTAGPNTRTSTPLAVTATGLIVGTSARQGASGAGQDVWLDDGVSSFAINLDGPGYAFTNASGQFVRSGNFVATNDAGQVLGTSSRFTPANTSAGTAGWLFDPNTGETHIMEFSFNVSTGGSTTTPLMLTETGVVLGTYQAFEDSTLLGQRAFWWSADDGFFDLGDLVEGGLDAAGWSFLERTYGQAVPGAAGVFAGGRTRVRPRLGPRGRADGRAEHLPARCRHSRARVGRAAGIDRPADAEAAAITVRGVRKTHNPRLSQGLHSSG